MPQDNMTLSTEEVLESPATIAELAKHFDIQHPMLAEVSPEDDWVEAAEKTSEGEEEKIELAEFNEEKTTRSWKESSWARIIIVSSALSILALGLLALFSMQLPEITPVTATKNKDEETKKEELLFADDGEYAAQSAYAGQSADFQNLQKEIQSQGQNPGTKPAANTPQATTVPGRPLTPPPVQRTVPVQRITTVPPPNSVIRIPRQITRPTAPPFNTNSSAAPSTPKRAIASPPPSPPKIVAPVVTSSPVKSAPQPRKIDPVVQSPAIDPMEQWLLASGAGITEYPEDIPADGGSSPANASFSSGPVAQNASFSSYEESVFGLTLPIGTSMLAQLASPVVFSPDLDNNQTVLIQTEGNEYMPPAQLVATYTPASNSQSRKVVVQLEAQYFVIDGETIPVNPQSILITAKNGGGLIAKQNSSGGGFLATVSKIVLGGGKAAFSELTKPQSQVITSGPQGSSSATQFGNSNVFAGAGFGIAEQGLTEFENRIPSEPSLDGVWQMDPDQKLEIHFMEDVFI